MGAAHICALAFLAGVLYPVAEFYFLGVIPAIRSANEVSSNAPDTLKAHIFADPLRISPFARFQ